MVHLRPRIAHDLDALGKEVVSVLDRLLAEFEAMRCVARAHKAKESGELCRAC